MPSKQTQYTYHAQYLLVLNFPSLFRILNEFRLCRLSILDIKSLGLMSYLLAHQFLQLDEVLLQFQIEQMAPACQFGTRLMPLEKLMDQQFKLIFTPQIAEDKYIVKRRVHGLKESRQQFLRQGS